MRETYNRALRFSPAENRQVPRGPVLECLGPGVVLLFQVEKDDMAGVTGGKAGDLQVVMHQPAGLGKGMVFRGEELFLVVVVRTPREHAGEVQMFTQDLPH